MQSAKQPPMLPTFESTAADDILNNLLFDDNHQHLLINNNEVDVDDQLAMFQQSSAARARRSSAASLPGDFLGDFNNLGVDAAVPTSHHPQGIRGSSSEGHLGNGPFSAGAWTVADGSAFSFAFMDQPDVLAGLDPLTTFESSGLLNQMGAVMDPLFAFPAADPSGIPIPFSSADRSMSTIHSSSNSSSNNNNNNNNNNSQPNGFLSTPTTNAASLLSTSAPSGSTDFLTLFAKSFKNPPPMLKVSTSGLAPTPSPEQSPMAPMKRRTSVSGAPLVPSPLFPRRASFSHGVPPSPVAMKPKSSWSKLKIPTTTGHGGVVAVGSANGAVAVEEGFVMDTRPRDHVCLLCGNKFLRRQDLNRHEVTHSAVKQFSCLYGCGASFSRSDAMGRHMKSGRCRGGPASGLQAA